MSQKSQSDGGQKHFAAGRGLLAAAETLNYSMNDQRSNRQMGGMSMSSGVGSGVGIMENQEGGGSQMSRRGHISNTMKLFASLGLSPSDLDALADIPEEEISVESLPRILMQLKSRKVDVGDRRATGSSMNLDAGYRGGGGGGGGGWEGRMGSSSSTLGSSRPSADFGFGSMQDSSQGFGVNFGGGGGGGGGRERQFSDLSDRESYGGSTPSDPFLPRRMGALPSNGKIQDFLGSTPNMFPHVCSLCDFDVHSTMVSTARLLPLTMLNGR